MRGMTTVGKNQCLCGGGVPLNRLDVSDGAVFVVVALNDKDRASDSRQKFFDVPGAKFRSQPDIVPASKHFVDVVMVAGKFLAQISGLIQRTDGHRAAQAEIFNEDVRRFENQRSDAVRMCPRVDERD